MSDTAPAPQPPREPGAPDPARTANTSTNPTTFNAGPLPADTSTSDDNDGDGDAPERASDPGIEIGLPAKDRVNEVDTPGVSETPGGPGFPSVPDPSDTGANLR